jgi:hypothetical protein
MLPSEERSIREYPPPPRAESPVQAVQGWYYLVAGCWVAFAISTFASPVYPSVHVDHLWFVRLLAFVVAIVGVGLILASRRIESTPVASAVGTLLPLLLALMEVLGMLMNVLSTPFLIDLAMEAGFFVWWCFAMTLGGRAVSPGPQTPYREIHGHA